MSILTIISLLLRLASWFTRRAEAAGYKQEALDALWTKQSDQLAAARRARDDAERLPDALNDNDPNLRD